MFAPATAPFLGTQDGQNLISWRWSVTLPTNPVWRGSMHTIQSYRGNRPTNTQAGSITIHCATATACSVIITRGAAVSTIDLIQPVAVTSH